MSHRALRKDSKMHKINLHTRMMGRAFCSGVRRRWLWRIVATSQLEFFFVSIVGFCLLCGVSAAASLDESLDLQQQTSIKDFNVAGRASTPVKHTCNAIPLMLMNFNLLCVLACLVCWSARFHSIVWSVIITISCWVHDYNSSRQKGRIIKL